MNVFEDFLRMLAAHVHVDAVRSGAFFPMVKQFLFTYLTNYLTNYLAEPSVLCEARVRTALDGLQCCEDFHCAAFRDAMGIARLVMAALGVRYASGRKRLRSGQLVRVFEDDARVGVLLGWLAQHADCLPRTLNPAVIGALRAIHVPALNACCSSVSEAMLREMPSVYAAIHGGAMP